MTTGCIPKAAPSNPTLRRVPHAWSTRSKAALIGATTVPTSLSFTDLGYAQDQPAPTEQPNIVVIMGDDIGWFNIGAYHRGMMSGKTPNIDRLAAEGMMFTDYYAEASCTAGRANFITGELPIRTGMTTVGQAGATSVCRPKRVTIATVLRRHGLRHGPVRQEPPGRPE